MSRIVEVATEIRDLEALAAACNELGLRLDTNSRTFVGYYGRNEKGHETPCDAEVVVPGIDYTIGLKKTETGYTLAYDHWQGIVDGKVGENAGRLLQMYAVHKAVIEARKKGLWSRRETARDGSILLRIGGM